MQEIRVWSLILEDFTCHGATELLLHNYWACALEPRSHSQACAPTACMPRQQPPQWEAHAPKLEIAPPCHNWGKHVQQWRPITAKSKQINITPKNDDQSVNLHWRYMVNFYEPSHVSLKKQKTKAITDKRRNSQTHHISGDLKHMIFVFDRVRKLLEL